MTLYSKNGSYPKPIPDRIRLSDGSTRTDSSTYTPEEIADAGYVAVSDKPVTTMFQNLEWSGTEWVVTDWTTQQKSYYWRQIRDARLEDTDIFGLADVTMSPEMATYRQALRDIPQQVGFPENIVWPTLPEPEEI